MTTFSRHEFINSFTAGNYTLAQDGSSSLRLDDLSKAEARVYSERLARNPHVKASDTRDVVIVIGDETHSTLLDQAILLAKASANHRRERVAVYVFSDEMVELIGVSGTI